ncbi:hypothetical protein D3C80_743050 [compost metagenome]
MLDIKKMGIQDDGKSRRAPGRGVRRPFSRHDDVHPPARSGPLPALEQHAGIHAAKAKSIGDGVLDPHVTGRAPHYVHAVGERVGALQVENLGHPPF